MEPYRTEVDTSVRRCGTDDHGRYALIDDLLFYPEGGGQPADHGWLDDSCVIDVKKTDGQVRVYLSDPVTEGQVRARLDWPRRFDHMQQHTAQHMITALARDRFGWATTAFHLGTELSDIELDAATVDRERLDEIEELAADTVRASLPVTARRVTAEALSSLPVRTRGLPEGHEGDVRLIEIPGLDLNTCGGTHVASTAELEAIKLLHTEPMRGGTRVYFAAGRRLRRRLAAHEARNAELRRALEAADDELVKIASLRGEQVKDLERSLRRAQEELVALWAATLAARARTVVDERFADREMGFLVGVARAFVERAPDKSVLLTCTSDSGGLFVLGVGDEIDLDVAAVGREVAEAMAGRGGGSGRLFQGKADRPDLHEAAVAVLQHCVS